MRLNLGLEPTVVIHPGQVKGFNVDELEMEAARIVERIRVVLEQKFGMQLSESGTPLHNPRWRIYRPECHAWILVGTVEVDGVGALDHIPHMIRMIRCRVGLIWSIVIGVWLLELQVIQLRMIRVNGWRFQLLSSLVLANLEAKLDALYGQFERLAAANKRLTDMMLGRRADLKEPDELSCGSDAV